MKNEIKMEKKVEKEIQQKIILDKVPYMNTIIHNIINPIKIQEGK